MPIIQQKKKLLKIPKNTFNPFLKGLFIYLAIGILVMIFLANLGGSPSFGEEIPITQVIQEVKEGKVKRLEVEGDKVIVIFKESEKKAYSRKEPTQAISDLLKDSGVDPSTVPIQVKDISWQQTWLALLGQLLPLVLMIGFLFFLIRQAREGAPGIFSFGQSRAKVFTKDQPQIKFSDVAGVEEAKKELQEVVEFLKTPEKFRALGARIPKGVLLVGPSGVGKTMLARAVAGEAGVPFFSIAGSEFMEMLVGVGAARVRDLFAQAKKAAPSIIFIDEIESIGRMRGLGISGGHDEREQTLNQILVEMDGFTPNDNVIVIGATNRPDLLDPALIRPGRFDRRVVLDLPDLEERKAIILTHARGKPLAPDVDIDKLAKRTVMFSGADIANMLNEAAILAAREGKKAIDSADLEEAATKVKLGPQRKRLPSEKERRLAAYHEAGHAIVAHFLPHMDPVHRISIVARGLSGGHTLFPPTEDRTNETRSRLIEQIATAMGGRIAEKLFLDDISTGAAADIDQATDIARRMVTEYGMSDLGPIKLAPTRMFGVWRGLDEQMEISPELHNAVDREIKKILEEAEKMAERILRLHAAVVEKLAKALLEKETIDDEEFVKLVGPKPAVA